MTNLEVLRQELKEFIDKASEADLMKVVLDSGREICYHCAFDYMSCGCGKEEYMQIEQIVNELVNKKILERCKE